MARIRQIVSIKHLKYGFDSVLSAFIRVQWLYVMLVALSGCAGDNAAPLPTPVPGELLPTVIALTLQAGDEALPGTPSATPVDSFTPTAASSSRGTATALALNLPPGQRPSATPAVTADLPGTATGLETALSTPRGLSPTPTAPAEIPNAAIEINAPGSLSRVTSPIEARTYLRSGAGGRVLFELLGEDGRLLYRQLRVVNSVPAGAYAFLTQSIDFEIAATAETGRLQISTQDEYGRMVALNSVPLILLSIGEADLIPAMDLRAPVVIEEPGRNKLIQGGQVTVSGMVRPANDLPLLVKLLTSDGRELGSRLASQGEVGPDGYAPFTAEVPFTVSKLTDTLVVVTAGGNALNDVIYLTSVGVRLAP